MKDIVPLRECESESRIEPADPLPLAVNDARGFQPIRTQFLEGGIRWNTLSDSFVGFVSTVATGELTEMSSPPDVFRDFLVAWRTRESQAICWPGIQEIVVENSWAMFGRKDGSDLNCEEFE
jgi:hypothetical protein